jgi:NADH:ubiquinone oxidoreductase subunit 4 (subunit M)
VKYYTLLNALSEVGGLKAALSGFALVFTSVYLMWMKKELYSRYGEKKGYKTYEEFNDDLHQNLSFENMFDSFRRMKALLTKLDKFENGSGQEGRQE